MIFSIGCRAGDEVAVQKVEPNESVDLPNILDKIPSLVSLAESIDLAALDDLTLDKGPLTSEEITREIQAFMRYTQLASGPVPGVIDAVSGAVNSTFRKFLFRSDEFASIKKIADFILNQKAEDMAEMISVMGSFLQGRVNDQTVYASAQFTQMPAQTTWSNCDEHSGVYRTSRDAVLQHHETEEDRKSEIKTLGNLRLFYCALQGESGIINDDLGLHIHKYLKMSKTDQLDAETPVLEELEYIRNNFSEIVENEKKLAEWLALDDNKIRLVDLLLSHAPVILSSDAIFNELRAVLDPAAGFITGKNPETGEYLVNDIKTAIYEEADKLDHLEDFFKNAVDDMPIVKTFSDIFENNTHGLTKAINTYGKEKLLDIAWDGRSNTSNQRLLVFPEMCFSDSGGTRSSKACDCIKHYEPTYGSNKHEILKRCIRDCVHEPYEEHCGDKVGINYDDFDKCYQTDSIKTGSWSSACYEKITVTTNLTGNGILRPGTEIISSNRETVPFRRMSNSVIADYSDSYENETLGESLATNLKVYLQKNYSDGENRMVFSRDQADASSSDSDRNLMTLMSQVQYSGFNLANLDRFGKSGSGEASLFSSLTYMLGTSLEGFQLNRPTLKLKDLTKSMQDLSYTGNLVLTIDAGDEVLSLPIACTYNQCNSPMGDKDKGTPFMRRVYRGAKGEGLQRYQPNTEMPVAEFFTPGKFVKRNKTPGEYRDAEFYHNSWRGKLSPHQGDVENSNFQIGPVINSLLAMHSWQGYGPFSVEGKAPNGTKVKYQNDFYTDRYSADFTITESNSQSSSSSNNKRIALGTNFGLSMEGIGASFTAILEARGNKYIRNLSDSSPSGNLHIYEKIYRPAPGDPCYSDATENGKYPYPRYGYLRRSIDTNYHDNSHCKDWQAVQIDFDSIEEAVAANIRFLAYDKKFTLVVPMSFQEKDQMFLQSFSLHAAIFAVAQANGLLGLAHFRPAYGNFFQSGIMESTEHVHKPTMGNGSWNFFSLRCPTERYGEQYLSKKLGTQTRNGWLGYYGRGSYKENLDSIKFDYPNGRDERCNQCNPLEEEVGTFKGHPIYKECPFGTRYISKDGSRGYEHFTGAHSNHVAYNAGVAQNNVTFAEENEAEGATATNRFKKTSFEKGDSSLLLLINIRGFDEFKDFFPHNFPKSDGIVATKDNIMRRILTLFPLTENGAMWNNITSTVRTLFSDYKVTEVASDATSNEFNKFREFYETYFPEDKFDSNGAPGADGFPDLWQKYQMSVSNTGCIDQTGLKISFCLTAAEMPYVPKVKGVSYPSQYNNTGNIENWQDHEGYSEFKLQPLLVGAGIAVGTEFDRKKKYVSTSGAKCSFSGSVENQSLNSGCFVLSEGQRSDDYHVMGYLRDEYKSISAYKDDQKKISKLALLNEQKLEPIVDHGTLYDDTDNLNPYYQVYKKDEIHKKDFRKSADIREDVNYSSSAFGNAFVETSKGARDGFLPWFFSRSFWHLPSLEHEMRDSVTALFAQFEFLKKYEEGKLTTWQKLRYFFTGEVSGSGKLFSSNSLQALGGEPVNLLKKGFALARTLGDDEAVLQSVTAMFEVLSLSAKIDKKPGSQIDGKDISKVIQILNKKNDQGEYVSDNIVDTLAKHKALDPEFITSISIGKIQALLSDIKPSFDLINAEVIKQFGEKHDLRKKILYGTLINEPWYDANQNGFYDAGEPYYDYNGDLKFNEGSFKFNEFEPATMVDFTDHGGLYRVETKVPNIFNLGSMVFSSKNENEPEEDITRGKILESLNDATAITYVKTLTDIQGEIQIKFDELYATTTSEPSTDFNHDGVIEQGEFTDYNNNGVADSQVPLRDYFAWLKNDIRTSHEAALLTGNLTPALNTIDRLLNPECISFVAIDCIASNPNYLTANLLTVRNKLLSNQKLPIDAIASLREIAAPVLVDPDTNMQTNVLAGLKQAMVPVMQLGVGNNSASRDANIELFATRGAGRYIVNNLRMGPNINVFDLLKDANTLMHIREFRGYLTSDTLWWQLSKHLSDFSKLAYKHYSQSFAIDVGLYTNFRDLLR